jgi:tetratricopeptide (TPR) repeat protein
VQAAEAELASILGRDPCNGHAWHMRGQLLQEAGDFQGAADAFRQGAACSGDLSLNRPGFTHLPVVAQSSMAAPAPLLIAAGPATAERAGALLCAEGLALLEAFRGQVDAARATFQAAAEARQPSGRLLREWALFEKRQGRLQVGCLAHALSSCW